MKKTLSLALCLVFCLGLGACGGRYTPPVISALDLEGRYTDGLGNRYDFHYRIPALTAQNGQAAALNQAVMDRFEPIVEQERANMDQGLSLIVEAVDYQVWLNGSFLSILVSAAYPNDQTLYMAVNYDAEKETAAGLSALCEQAGLPEEGFLPAARAALDRAYRETFGDSQAGSEGYSLTMSRLTAPDYSPNVYLDGDGKLCLAASLEGPAGSVPVLVPVT